MTSTIDSLEKIQLLMVEDDQIDRLAFTRTVKQYNLPYEYTLASSLSEALEILRENRKFQIAILDYNLGDGRSSELFPILKEQNCPFVISTGSGDEETAARLMSQGAADYLIKDPERNYLKILPATISKTLSRHQTEGKLQLLNRAITSVKDSIYVLDCQGKLQYINNTLAEFSNISPEEAIGQPSQILKQPYLNEWLREIRSCSDESCSTEAEILMQRADGTNFVALVSETCVIENMHLRRVGVIRDVSSLKKIEVELRNYQEGLENIVKERTAELQQAIAELQKENQERLKIEESLRASRDQLQQQQDFFKLVIDSNPNLIFVKDWDGHYLLANQTMAKFYNTTVENLVGKTDSDFHSNSIDAERFLQENRQIIESQQDMFLPEEKISHADLGSQWLQWQKRPIKIFGNTNGVLGVGVNITARKQIEISLSESQKRFESLAAVAPVGIYRTNTTGDCIYVNDRWCEIAGLTAAEAAGPNWARALHPDDREKVAAEWYASVQENRPFELECRFQKPDGTVTWVLSRARAEHNIYGEIIGYVGTITDISDRKRVETILQKLVTGTAAVTGADFFVELVRHIAEALDVAYAVVTEFVSDHLVTLGFWANGSLQPSISYVPAKTPCEISLQKGQYHCEQYVAKIFAEDLDLVTMQAESYLGIALKDDQGRSIGNLCVLDTQPIPETKKVEAIGLLQVFAARASAELQRKNANEALNRLNQDLEMRVQQRTQELQERERFLQTVLDSFPLAVFWKDRQSVLLGCNQIFANSSGLESPLEVIGKTNFDFSFTEEEALKFLADDQSVMESGLSKIGIEESFTLDNGEINWIETNKIPLRDALGEVIGLVGTFQDISDRKKAETELLESQRFLQLVLDTFPLFVFWKDRQSVYLGCNQNFAVGACLNSPSEIVGKTDYEMPWGESDAEKYRNDDQQVITSSSAKLNIIETQYQANGQIIWLETNKIPLRDLQGNVIGVLGTYQDISDRKQAEAQLQRINNELLRATRLKDEFLANMSHELRTPLNAILGLSETLKEEILGSLNVKQLKAIATIESSGEHLLSLINDILDLSKISSGMMNLDISSVSVRYLCNTSLSFVRQQAFQKSIQINSNIPALINNINIDERRIKQVLINLLTNAVKFTPSGGKVNLLLAIGSGDTWQGEAIIPQQLKALNSPMLLFQVVDTGIGISSNDLQILFQPFVQVDSALNRQYEGTGLGLALVKQIVEMLGGQVMVESELGKGSRFTVALPYDMPQSSALFDPVDPTLPQGIYSENASDNASDNAPENEPEKAIAPLILLAEDNEANIQTFSDYLIAINYRVVVARNGEEAVAMTKANSPDMILMDIQMPIMDGLEAIKQIRLEPNLIRTPIIALTALAMEGDREMCLAAGANEYLSKPVKLRQLATKIAELLPIPSE